MDDLGFGFGGKKPVPCSSRANDLANAFLALAETKGKLDRAMEEVPDYTGEWNSSDYYAEELEAYYRAADEMAEIIDAA